VAGDETPRVLLFYIDAGGGHRSAMRALVAAAEERAWPYRFEPVNLQAILTPLDFTRHVTGVSVEEAYNVLLRREYTGIMTLMLWVLHGLIRLRRRPIVRLLTRFLAERRPAPVAVLSVMPNFNALFRDACRAALPGTPLLVALTDLADLPPHFWLESGLDRVLVATDEAARQAAVVGLPSTAVVRTSGMILHPRFYAASPTPDVRGTLRAELGFADADFVVMLLFGGKGSPEIERLAHGLLARQGAWRVLAVCGDNPRLLARLEPLVRRSAGRLRALGFTDRVADYLTAADLLVTKPGPGSLSEAFQRRIPVVVAGNRATLPQERYNVRLVAEKELGLVVRRWSEVPAAIESLLADPGRLERLRRNLATLPANNAVYETLDAVAEAVRRR
jgi:processive 1,2-diacylglycerol beta-glucosyltransferase